MLPPNKKSSNRTRTTGNNNHYNNNSKKVILEVIYVDLVLQSTQIRYSRSQLITTTITGLYTASPFED